MATRQSAFEQAFRNSIYLSEDYARFCSRVTALPITHAVCHGMALPLIRRTAIAVSHYSDEAVRCMREKEISFISVTPEENEHAAQPSMLEYPLIFRKSYREAYDALDRTFKKEIRRAEKNTFGITIVRGCNQETIAEASALYHKQARRLNTFFFPQSFFEEFMRMQGAVLFTARNKGKMIAYSFCLENKDNLYTSIGGADESYFESRINYLMYHEKIRYACEKKLTMHLGLSVRGSGHADFKRRAGATAFRCDCFPKRDRMLRCYEALSRYRVTGIALGIASRSFPKAVIINAMPFT